MYVTLVYRYRDDVGKASACGIGVGDGSDGQRECFLYTLFRGQSAVDLLNTSESSAAGITDLYVNSDNLTNAYAFGRSGIKTG